MKKKKTGSTWCLKNREKKYQRKCAVLYKRNGNLIQNSVNSGIYVYLLLKRGQMINDNIHKKLQLKKIDFIK